MSEICSIAERTYVITLFLFPSFVRIIFPFRYSRETIPQVFKEKQRAVREREREKERERGGESIDQFETLEHLRSIG